MAWVDAITGLLKAVWPALFIAWLFFLRKDIGILFRAMASFFRGAATLMRRLSAPDASSAIRRVTKSIDEETHQIIDLAPILPKERSKRRKVVPTCKLPAPLER
jgi:hypothetical protein